MKRNNDVRTTGLVLSAALAIGVGALVVPAAAVGQGADSQAADMGGIGASQTVTMRAQVKAIDLASRGVTLVGPQGNAMFLRVGEQVRNLDKVAVGDTVTATYYASLVLVLSAPGAAIPRDQAAAALARAPEGQEPAGAAASRVIVTGTVVSVDLEAHTVSLVDPSGGLVRTFTVKDPQRQAAMQRVKVGDSLTAVVTEALAIALEPG